MVRKANQKGKRLKAAVQSAAASTPLATPPTTTTTVNPATTLPTVDSFDVESAAPSVLFDEGADSGEDVIVSSDAPESMLEHLRAEKVRLGERKERTLLTKKRQEGERERTAALREETKKRALEEKKSRKAGRDALRAQRRGQADTVRSAARIALSEDKVTLEKDLLCIKEQAVSTQTRLETTQNTLVACTAVGEKAQLQAEVIQIKNDLKSLDSRESQISANLARIADMETALQPNPESSEVGRTVLKGLQKHFKELSAFSAGQLDEVAQRQRAQTAVFKCMKADLQMQEQQLVEKKRSLKRLEAEVKSLHHVRSQTKLRCSTEIGQIQHESSTLRDTLEAKRTKHSAVQKMHNKENTALSKEVSELQELVRQREAEHAKDIVALNEKKLVCLVTEESETRTTTCALEKQEFEVFVETSKMEHTIVVEQARLAGMRRARQKRQKLIQKQKTKSIHMLDLFDGDSSDDNLDGASTVISAITPARTPARTPRTSLRNEFTTPLSSARRSGVGLAQSVHTSPRLTNEYSPRTSFPHSKRSNVDKLDLEVSSDASSASGGLQDLFKSLGTPSKHAPSRQALQKRKRERRASFEQVSTPPRLSFDPTIDFTMRPRAAKKPRLSEASEDGVLNFDVEVGLGEGGGGGGGVEEVQPPKRRMSGVLRKSGGGPKGGPKQTVRFSENVEKKRFSVGSEADLNFLFD